MHPPALRRGAVISKEMLEEYALARRQALLSPTPSTSLDLEGGRMEGGRTDGAAPPPTPAGSGGVELTPKQGGRVAVEAVAGGADASLNGAAAALATDGGGGGGGGDGRLALRQTTSLTTSEDS